MRQLWPKTITAPMANAIAKPCSYSRQAIGLFIYGICLFILSTRISANEPPISTLTLGYAPILSRPLVESRSKPLINYFKTQHQVDIQLVHSTSFDDYLTNALNHKFDLTISQVNYAEAFHSELKFKPLVKSKRHFHLLVLKRKNDHSIHSLAELTNKTIGVPKDLSLISALFSQTLKQHGIDATKQVNLVSYHRHDLLFLSLLRAEIDAAITVEITLEMATYIKSHLAVVHKIPAGPAVFSASPKINKKQQQWLTKALLGFSQSPQGKTYLSSLSFDQLETVNELEIRQFHRYALPLHEKLKKQTTNTTPPLLRQ